MTGPEHYQAAQELLDRAVQAGFSAVVPNHGQAARLAAAQVHATLALAAATAEVEPTKAWYETVVGGESPAVKP